MILRFGGMVVGALGGLQAGVALAQQQAPLTPSDPAQALPSTSEAGSPLQMPPPAPPPTPPPPVPSPQARTFVLAQVEFHGATVLAPAALEPAWSAFRGKPVTLRDLRAIASAGEKIYAASGHPFVAFVVPAQDVRDGLVRIEVVEGHISDLTVLGRDPVARRQTAAAFTPLVGVSPLGADQVARAYDLAQDIPGIAMAGSLRPGGQAGGMDLVVKSEHRDWRLYANVNNFYPDPVGPWGVLLGAEYDGRSLYGDQTTLQLFSTTDTDEQQVIRASHMRRLNSSGTSITGSFLYADADPKGAVAPLDLATKVIAARLEADQPFVRRADFALDGGLALDWTDQDTLVFQNVDLTKDKLRVLVARAFGRLGLKGSQVAEYEIEVRKGLGGLGASDRGDPNLSRFGADPEATVVRGSASGEIKTPVKTRISWKVEGQWANHSLAAPEEYVVGNLTVGRGFEPGAAYGDSALAFSLESRWGAFHPRPNLAVEPYAFFDAVELWNKEAGAPNHRWVASAGGGVRIEVLQRARFDLFYAQPLDAPLGQGERKPGGSVYLNFTAAIPDVFRGLATGLRKGIRP